jgi:hypothetical protein
MVRVPIALAAAALVGVGLPAGAQPYPMIPDRTIERTPAFPTQGPAPLMQQATPNTTPGDMLVRRRLDGAARTKIEVISPSELRFRQADGMPRGVQSAISRQLSGGRVEQYVRIPAGGTIPRHWYAVPVEIVFLADPMVLVDRGTELHPPPRSLFTIPAKGVHALTCPGSTHCLVIIRTSAPGELHYLNPAEADLP